MRDPPLILAVDDMPENLEILRVRLEANGYEVTTAADGEEGLAAARRLVPDLILLDIMMPKMSGFEVCKRIKSDPKTRDITVIMVTALNETGDVERAAECGTDDYLSKPIDRRALVEQVRGLLAGKSRG